MSTFKNEADARTAILEARKSLRPDWDVMVGPVIERNGERVISVYAEGPLDWEGEDAGKGWVEKSFSWIE